MVSNILKEASELLRFSLADWSYILNIVHTFVPEQIPGCELQPSNYQVSKSIVHEIKFGEIAVM